MDETAATSVNPLAQAEAQPQADGAGDRRLSDASKASIGSSSDGKRGQVDISAFLADTRSYHGVNYCAWTLCSLLVGLGFLWHLVQSDITRNGVQIKEWSLPTEENVRDAKALASFSQDWYGRIVQDPMLDGHNRVLLGYVGVAGWAGGTGHLTGATAYPHEETCEFPSVDGRYPSQLVETGPFAGYRMPCPREHEYDDGTQMGRLGGEAFSGPVLKDRYNFSAVMHWYTHDYALVYSCALKETQQDKHIAEIEKLKLFIEQFDPVDLKFGLVSYNPHLELANWMEIQFRRTHGTSHRTVGGQMATYRLSSFPASYYVWGFLLVLCFFSSIFSYGRGTVKRARYFKKFRRVQSDYRWRRFDHIRDDEDEVDEEAAPGIRACVGHCCGCSTAGSAWGFIEGTTIVLLGITCFFTMIRLVYASPGLWTLLPPPESEDSLGDHEKEWEAFFLEVLEQFGISLGGLHMQFAALGMANMLQFALLIRDLRWHDGVSVLTKTLTFAGYDLQDVMVVTAVLVGAFASMSFGMFGGYGSQDSFSSWTTSFKTLGLLGFGKSLGYDSLVNDDLGSRFDGFGMHVFSFLKPIIFWVLTFLLVWVIPNIILAIIVEGFERHVDVANQRPKVTLLQLLRRRVWYHSRSEEQRNEAPRWARQMAVCSTPIAAKVLAGLSNPISAEILPEEVKRRYVARTPMLERPSELGDLRTPKQRGFYCIQTAAELHSLLHYAVAEAEDGRSEFHAEASDTAEVDQLAQEIWRWFSDDGEGGGWAESVAEDHEHSEGGSGNHIRSVIRNELRQLETRLATRTIVTDNAVAAESEVRVEARVEEMLVASEARIAALLESKSKSKS